MHFIVEPSALRSGSVSVPGDKSISHRALMLASIAEGETHIRGFLDGEDCLATMAALVHLGATIDATGRTNLIVRGRGKDGLSAPAGELDLGNSGTAMRLMTGILAGQPFTATLTGDLSLSARPMDRIIEPLAQMGVRIDSDDGRPPLTIHGNPGLSGILYELPVASAQVKSAVLLAGLYAKNETTIIEPSATRDHTERMLAAMGADIAVGETQIVLRGGQSLSGAEIEVPGDLSSAAFLIGAALLADAGELMITNVGVNPTRTGVIDILRSMGGDIELENVRLYGEEPVADIRVRASRLVGVDIDPALAPLAIDEFPLLFVAAAAASGVTRFSGLGELRVKESDRISAMCDGLRALGIALSESEDGATVQGGAIAGGSVQSCGDHRIAMAFAIAGTIAQWPVRIEDTAAVDTSFPGFVESLRSLGVNITCAEDAVA